MDLPIILEVIRDAGIIGVLAIIVAGFFTDRLRTGTMSDRREEALVKDGEEWKKLYFDEVARANAADDRSEKLAEALSILVGGKIKLDQ